MHTRRLDVAEGLYIEVTSTALTGHPQVHEESHHVIVAPSVAEALKARRPIVALETTLVMHGFPHPEGLKIAGEVEAAVAAGGAHPATIGIVDGRIHVGLGHVDQKGRFKKDAASKIFSSLKLLESVLGYGLMF